MKVLDTRQIRSADAYTIAHEPISSVDLMERAAKTCFEKIINIDDQTSVYHIYCGTGNNGGDGLVMARLLHEIGKDVHVYIVRFSDKSTNDFNINLQRLEEFGIPCINVLSKDQLPNPLDGVIIDSMLGTGVTRPLDGLLKDVASSINGSGLKVYAVDLPSGLFDRGNTIDSLSVCVKASYTLSFQVPKLCFFLSETEEILGQWYVLDIGLNKDFIDSCESDYQTYEFNNAVKDLKQRSAYSHKGTYGHSCLALGSKGKMGAAVLCAEACLRSGAGLTTCYLPKCGYDIMQQSLPEAMVWTSSSEDVLDKSCDLSSFDVVGVGPGIGTSEETALFIKNLIESFDKPLVIDADALNIISKNPILQNKLPKNSILTPHPKEFERLFGKTESSESRLELLQKKAVEFNVIIVLKGHFTATAIPSGNIYFNTTGNPGMATGGSGDILTGILTSLIAQKYSPEDAALLGVFLHGLAGDLAAEELSQEAMIASDITAHLGNAFNKIHSLQEK